MSASVWFLDDCPGVRFRIGPVRAILSVRMRTVVVMGPLGLLTKISQQNKNLWSYQNSMCSHAPSAMPRGLLNRKRS